MENTKLREELQDIIERYKGFLQMEGLRKELSVDSIYAYDLDTLLNYHSNLLECEAFLRKGKNISIPSLMDLEKTLKDLSKMMSISIRELYEIRNLLQSTAEIKNILSKEEEYPFLLDISYELDSLPDVFREIERSIGPDLSISSNASAELSSIRADISKVEKELLHVMETYRRRYSKYLNSDSVVLRSGVETLPVKISDRGNVKGSVVAYSNTGETCFIVPYEVMDMHHQYENLKLREEDEITKIIGDLSKRCSKNIDKISKNYHKMLVLDRFFGSVNFGHSYSGTIAEYSENLLNLSSFFHPLLNADPVICNSLSLGDNHPRILLITGPNAGGKSVLIRSVGLALLMDRCGLFVPCHSDSSLPFVDNVFYLGGDNQSVLDNLSTFSSHLLSLKSITDKATSSSLVIIDEVGEGTSPKDGEALGVSILEYFKTLGSFTLLTSHFDGMKEKAFSDERILSGAMEFERSTLSPTYRLLLNTTGNSYGLVLAEKMGLRREILTGAKSYIESLASFDYEQMLDNLALREENLRKREERLKNKENKLDSLNREREKEISSLENEKRKIRDESERRIDELVLEKKKEIDEIFRSSKGSTSFSEVSRVKGELSKISKKDEIELSYTAEKLSVGDKVLDEEGRTAEIVDIKKGQATLDYDGLRIKRKTDGLKKKTSVQGKIRKKAYVDTVHLDLNPSRGLELNIIGLHVDEAMREVVAFIDSCRVRKLSSIRIIHGAGTFALKNAVWKYLDNHKEFVKDYRLGGEGEGGLGATIVHLK